MGAGGPAALRRLARAAVALKSSAERDPLSAMRWLTPQLALLRSTAPKVLLRCGNQSYGKTTVGLAEVCYACQGQHPFKSVRQPPIEAWVLCASWSQSISIQNKLWNIVPKTWVMEDQRFDPVRGFGGHHPALRFRNGSIIRIKTTKQEALDLAGASIDLAMFDEPPYSERVYQEVVKRVQARAGRIILTLTPINRPTDWLRELCDRGLIEDLHFPLRAQHLIPEGDTRPMILPNGQRCDARWIEERRQETLDYEEPVTIDGEWEVRLVDRQFAAFVSDPSAAGSHVTSHVPDVDFTVRLGVDHGTNAGNQAGVLVGVDYSDPDGWPDVWVLAETPQTGPTTSEQDARELLNLLGVMGWRWSDVATVYGDIPAGHGASRKGNRDLADALARELGKPSRRDIDPRVRTAKMGRSGARGSVLVGERWLHQMMVRGKFHVHPRCSMLIESLNKYDGRAKSEWKHYIDALRYALRDDIYGRSRRRRPVIVNG